MKRALLFAICAGIFAFAATGVNAQDQRIVTVSLAKVLKEYYKTKEMQKTLEESYNVFRKEYKNLQDDYVKLQEKMESLSSDAKSTTLSEEKRKSAQKELDERQIERKRLLGEVQKFQQDREQQLTTQQNRIMANLLKDVNRVVEDLAKQKDYSIVLDSSAGANTGTIAVVYSKANLDISDEVIHALNANAPPATEPSSTNGPAASSSGK